MHAKPPSARILKQRSLRRLGDHCRYHARIYLMQQKLELVYATVRESIGFRRDREQQIFGWSSALLVAVISALLLTGIDPNALISSTRGKIAGTVLVGLIVTGSIFWQQKQRDLLCGRQKHAAKIMDELGLFDLSGEKSGESIIPAEWKGWGSRNNTLWTQMKQPSKILFTVLLGVAAVIVVWIR